MANFILFFLLVVPFGMCMKPINILEDHDKLLNESREKLVAKRDFYITFRGELKPNLIGKLNVKREELFDSFVLELNPLKSKVEIALSKAKEEGRNAESCNVLFEEQMTKLLGDLQSKLNDCVMGSTDVMDNLMKQLDTQIGACEELISRIDNAHEKCAPTGEGQEECILEIIQFTQLFLNEIFPILEENNRGFVNSATEIAMTRLFRCNQQTSAEIHSAAVSVTEITLNCIRDALPNDN